MKYTIEIPGVLVTQIVDSWMTSQERKSGEDDLEITAIAVERWLKTQITLGVEISLGYGNRVVEIPAQSADEARAIGRGYDGVEQYVYSVKGKFHDWPGKDQLPSLTRAARQ